MGALALSSLLGVAGAVSAPSAVAETVSPEYAASLLPEEWRFYASTPTEWVHVIDAATRAIPNWYEGAAVLNPGQAIEVRAKLVFRDMPPLGSTLRTTLVRVADLEGGAGPWAPVELAAPAYSEHVREMWTEYRVPDDGGGAFLLALTADPLDGGPGYFVAAVPVLVLPPLTDPADFRSAIVPEGSLPSAPPPQPEPPAQSPAEPAPVPQAQTQAPSAPQQTTPAEPAPSPAAVAETPGASAPALASGGGDASEPPAWLLPAAGAAVVLAIVAAATRRTVSALQRRASIRRLERRP